MTEQHHCFIHNIDVTVIDGKCTTDCSIEDCLLNSDNAPGEWKKRNDEETDSANTIIFETLHGEE